MREGAAYVGSWGGAGVEKMCRCREGDLCGFVELGGGGGGGGRRKRKRGGVGGEKKKKRGGGGREEKEKR